MVGYITRAGERALAPGSRAPDDRPGPPATGGEGARPDVSPGTGGLQLDVSLQISASAPPPDLTDSAQSNVVPAPVSANSPRAAVAQRPPC